MAERRLTEAELRRTQSDLIQAGKLATLGEMSAALSHKINQPLAAARNCADSAAIPMDRGAAAKAKDNFGQILSLIDRVATIARHLRNRGAQAGYGAEGYRTGCSGGRGVGNGAAAAGTGGGAGGCAG